jgi:hypothetical protein
MDRSGGNASRDQLRVNRGVEVDRRAARRASRDIGGGRSASGAERRHDVVPDLVAAPKYRRPQRDNEVHGVNVFRCEPLDRGRSDPRGDAAPSSVQRRHGGVVPIDEEDGNAIGGPHGGDGRSRTVPGDADYAVGGGRVREPWFRVYDNAAVHLPKKRRVRLT